MTLAIAAPVLAAESCEKACQEAERLAEAGRVEAAEAVYRGALEVDPDCAAAHYALGLLYLRRLDRPREAAAHFRRHLEIRPTVTTVRAWREEAESLDLFRSVTARALRPVPDRSPLKIETLAEIKLKKATEAEEKKESAPAKAAVDPAGELTIIAFRGIQGHVSGEKGDVWEIDVGSADGVVAGMTFAVTREGVWVGVLKAVTVGEHVTSCTPEAGRRAGIEAKAAWEFCAGDSVAQREDVLGEGVAAETRQRKNMQELQQQEQGLVQELKDIQNRQRRALREYAEKPTLAALAHFAETRAKLYAEYRSWLQRRSAWEEGLGKEWQGGTGNRQFEAYRALLRRQHELQDEDAGWEEILLDVRKDMMGFYADRGEALEKRRTELESKSKKIEESRAKLDKNITEFEEAQRAGKRGVSVGDVNHGIKIFNMEVEYFRKVAAAYDEDYARLQQELGFFAAELQDINRARERWQADDDVQRLLLGRTPTLLLESLVNAGQLELLRGRNAKALRKFRFALALEPGPEFETAARDGAELATLRLILRGEAVNEAGGPLAPPLRELWSAPIPGRPVGVMQSDSARIYAFHAAAGTG